MTQISDVFMKPCVHHQGRIENSVHGRIKRRKTILTILKASKDYKEAADNCWINVLWTVNGSFWFK